jgi:broad specificity phosphatase PhoE
VSRLVVVRHGQASFFAADYDVLSSLGEEQSRRLGEYWAERGVRVSRAFVGPRRRHLQTYGAVAAAFQSRGIAWPVAEELPELDEHHGARVVEHTLRAAGDGAPLFGAASGLEPAEQQRRYLDHFARIGRQWARGELTAPAVESFQQFRRRVEAGVQHMTAAVDAAAGEAEGVAVAFTSGGPVAAITGLALGLADETTLELSWSVGNASVSEFARRDGRVLLAVFNAAPHLEAEHASMV